MNALSINDLILIDTNQGQKISYSAYGGMSIETILNYLNEHLQAVSIITPRSSNRCADQLATNEVQ